MGPGKKTVFKTIFGVIALFLYCEYFIYYVVLYHCDWPSLDPKNEDQTIKSINDDPLKVMVIADTHLLGSRKGHWFDKLRREWQMYRTFQTAMKLHKPDAVFVLGDLFDEGLYCSKAEFEYYVNRFHSLFSVPDRTRLFVAVGNHDIGFHYSITPYLNGRFESAFNASAVDLVTLKGNHFVILNSMAMEGDGCFLCKPAQQQLARIERILQCAKGNTHLKCDLKKKIGKYSRPILMQHFPMFRESDAECNDFDSAPEPIKSERFRQKWECLSKQATYHLLNLLSPRVVMSGHTHHGCTRPLMTGEGIEITIPSFSWRNKKDPTYGLAVFTPNNFAYSRCAMVNENTVVSLYMFGGSGLVFWIGYCLIGLRRRLKFKIY